MDDSYRTSKAERIAEGQVSALSTEEVSVAGGTDFRTVFRFKVLRSLKGDLKPGQILQLNLRQTGRRPQGWAGPQGQNALPKEGQEIRVYLNGDHLLEPNGWESL